ncbi:hypothetical protein BD626DRAFT_404813 [Schizophyllum amplum]|uniref:F-box domain-containing protein n=1 Tax=Schizophyllum amplum TaxID=97359 RepID=A0A550CBC9_9AGAR|nr:hypothetical protein BD626DRAFT_404813 [Auriculariopsis ampla]
MDTCPTELHLYICQLVSCVDDGRTIRSLASVSHYYRSLARHLIHTSVSLSSAERIIDFARKLEDDTLRKGVRHLFMSDRHATSKSHPPQQTVQESIARILTLTGPALETLSIHCSSLLSSASLLAHTAFRIPLPRLEELAVHGLYPFPSDAHTHLPRLHRLHLSGHRNPHGLLQLGGIETACPDLRVLRIDGGRHWSFSPPASRRSSSVLRCSRRDRRAAHLRRSG